MMWMCDYCNNNLDTDYTEFIQDGELFICGDCITNYTDNKYIESNK